MNDKSTINCPGCAQAHEVTAEQAGVQTQCSACQSYFTIPSVEQSQYQAAQVAPPLYQAPSALVVPKWYATLTIMGPLCACLLLIGGGVTYWVINNRKVEKTVTTHFVEVVKAEPLPEPDPEVIPEPEPEPIPEPEPMPEPEPIPEPEPVITLPTLKEYDVAFNRSKLGNIIPGSLLVREGIVYFSREDYNIEAWDFKRKKLLWRREIENRVVHEITYYKDKLFFGGNDYFYALLAVTGEIKWQYKCAGSRGGARTDFRLYHGVSVKAENNHVYAASRDGKLHAINIETGEALWIFDAEKEVTSIPVIKDSKLYFVAQFDKIYCVEVDTGKLNWAELPEDKSCRFYTNINVFFESNDLVITDDYYYRLVIDIQTQKMKMEPFQRTASYSRRIDKELTYSSSPKTSLVRFHVRDKIKWEKTIPWHQYTRTSYPIAFRVDKDDLYYVDNRNLLHSINSKNGRPISSIDVGGWEETSTMDFPRILNKGNVGFIERGLDGKQFIYKNIKQNKIQFVLDAGEWIHYRTYQNHLVYRTKKSVHATDLTTGKRIWTHTLPENISLYLPQIFASESGVSVYLSSNFSTGLNMNTLFLLDWSKGKIISHLPCPKIARNFYILNEDNGILFCIIRKTESSGHEVQAISLTTRKLIWSKEGIRNVSVNANDFQFDGSILIMNKEAVMVDKNGNEKWKHPLRSDRFYITTTRDKDHIYIKNQEVLQCLNASDGSVAWDFILEGEIEGFSSILVHDTKLCVAGANRKIYIFDTLTGKLQKRSNPHDDEWIHFHQDQDLLYISSMDNKLYQIFLTSAPITRILTDTRGRAIKVELLSATNTLVTFNLLKDDTEHTIPLTNLSKEDQDYIKQWWEGNL